VLSYLNLRNAIAAIYGDTTMALHEGDFLFTAYNLGSAWLITNQGCKILHIPSRLTAQCGSESNYYANMAKARNELVKLVADWENENAASLNQSRL